jgi:hypothetical protein
MPIASVPGAVIHIIDRHTDDYNWNFRSFISIHLILNNFKLTNDSTYNRVILLIYFVLCEILSQLLTQMFDMLFGNAILSDKLKKIPEYNIWFNLFKFFFFS